MKQRKLNTQRMVKKPVEYTRFNQLEPVKRAEKPSRKAILNQPKNQLLSFRGQEDYYKSVSYDNLLKRPYLSPSRDKDALRKWENFNMSPKRTMRQGATMYTNKGNGQIEPMTVSNFKGKPIRNTVYQRESLSSQNNSLTGSPTMKMNKKRRSIKAFHHLKKEHKRSSSHTQLFGPVGAYELQPTTQNQLNTQINTARNFNRIASQIQQPQQPGNKTQTYFSKSKRSSRAPRKESALKKVINELVKTSQANYDLPKPLPMPKQIFEEKEGSLKMKLFHENLKNRQIPQQVLEENKTTKNIEQPNVEDVDPSEPMHSDMNSIEGL